MNELKVRIYSILESIKHDVPCNLYTSKGRVNLIFKNNFHVGNKIYKLVDFELDELFDIFGTLYHIKIQQPEKFI